MMKMHEDEVTTWIQEKLDLDENDDDATESDDQSAGGGDGVDVTVAAGTLGESDGDNTLGAPALSLGAEPPSASPSQQRQVLVPIVPPVSTSIGDTTTANISSEVRDVFMSTEQ